MKKTLHIWASVLIIVGIMISFSASAMIQIPEEEKTLQLKKIENCVAEMDIAKAKTLETQVKQFSEVSLDTYSEDNPRFTKKSSPLFSVRTMEALNVKSSHTLTSDYIGKGEEEPIFSGTHPAVASDSLGNVVLGFEDYDSDSVWFSASTDFGQTWPNNAVAWTIMSPKLPDVDSCGDGRFIGGMVPYYENSNEFYKVEVHDPGLIPDGYSCPYWSLDSYDNIKSVAAAGYTAEDPEENTWAFGSHAIVCDELVGSTGVPLYIYQFNAAGYAWFISFDETLVGCEVAANDIDLVTLESYGVWNFNNSGSMDLFFYKLDFGTWVPSGDHMIHPEIGSGIITTAGNDDYVDVSAHNDNVIIVSQRDGDIVAYYSYDGLDSIEETIIETGAVNPRIVHRESTAICTLIKDNLVFCTWSDDGGATWSMPIPVLDSDGVPQEYKAADVCGWV